MWYTLISSNYHLTNLNFQKIWLVKCSIFPHGDNDPTLFSNQKYRDFSSLLDCLIVLNLGNILQKDFTRKGTLKYEWANWVGVGYMETVGVGCAADFTFSYRELGSPTLPTVLRALWNRFTTSPDIEVSCAPLKFSHPQRVRNCSTVTHPQKTGWKKSKNLLLTVQVNGTPCSPVAFSLAELEAHRSKQLVVTPRVACTFP